MTSSRRTFLKTTAAGFASSLAAPAILRGQTTKSGAKHTLAVIGCGWWGTNILKQALADGRVKLVGLCDVDPAQLKGCSEAIAGLTSDAPKTYVDYREMLAEQKPQLVIVATPDHWHALNAIDSLKSGAHLYLEKPISHTVLEGAAIVKATRDAGRVVQVGTHRRVSKHNLSAREFIRSGKVGEIGMVRCFVNHGGKGEKPAPNSEPPEGMNWDMWCGPAPLRPFNRKIHPRGHRQFLDYANGQLGDWGIHWIDQVMWILEREDPISVSSAGGRSIKGPPIHTTEEQTTDAPDHQITTYSFDDGFTMYWEHRQFAGEPTTKHIPIGAHFHGTNGTFHLGWQDGWTFYPIDPKQPTQHEDPKLTGEFEDNVPELWMDFVDAVEQERDPACPIEAGHRATTAALLGMLSLKIGRSINWDGQNQTIPDDPEAAELLRRDYRGTWEYPR